MATDITDFNFLKKLAAQNIINNPCNLWLIF
jgi:hypothetical protein